jgi:hypothetical protein
MNKYPSPTTKEEREFFRGHLQTRKKIIGEGLCDESNRFQY